MRRWRVDLRGHPHGSRGVLHLGPFRRSGYPDYSTPVLFDKCCEAITDTGVDFVN